MNHCGSNYTREAVARTFDSTILDALAECARWIRVTSGDVCLRTRRIFVKILGARHSPCRGAKQRIESGDDKNETGWLRR